MAPRATGDVSVAKPNGEAEMQAWSDGYADGQADAAEDASSAYRRGWNEALEHAAAIAQKLGAAYGADEVVNRIRNLRSTHP